MLTSIDGKVTGKFLFQSDVEQFTEYYYQQHRNFQADGFLCGRTTMQGSFTGVISPELSAYAGVVYPREDFIPYPNATFYAIAIDSHCRLNWQDCCIHDEDPGYNQAYVIEILCENVSDAFLAFLRSKNVGYIFAGKETINLPLALHKLKTLCGINKLLLEGGGVTGASFARQDLIDEYSLVQTLNIVGDGETSLISDVIPKVCKLSLLERKSLCDGGTWLHLKVER